MDFMALFYKALEVVSAFAAQSLAAPFQIHSEMYNRVYIKILQVLPSSLNDYPRFRWSRDSLWTILQIRGPRPCSG
jgi:hypothetical protein